jgi:hypothetical protein
VPAKARLEHLFAGDSKKQRDEAFAVMFETVSCPSNTEYAKEMREAFDGASRPDRPSGISKRVWAYYHWK